jgi:hypothetical protein
MNRGPPLPVDPFSSSGKLEDEEESTKILQRESQTAERKGVHESEILE